MEAEGSQSLALTPTDEREINRQLAERSICKDVPIWKGYVELNLENPTKVKKLKFSKKILVISKYRIFIFDVKRCQREVDFNILDGVSIKTVKSGCFTLAFKKGLHTRNKAISLKKLNYLNINTVDDRKVERYILKAFQEGIRNNTHSWKVSRLEVDVEGTWMMELAPEKIGIANGLIDSYWALCDYRSKTPDRNFIRFVKDKCSMNDRDMVLSDCPGIESKHGTKYGFHVETIAEAFEHNTYFQSFVIQNVVCKEAAEAASILMMKNTTIKKMVIKNCSTTFSSNFGYALYYNKKHCLSIIDLSQNNMPNSASIPFAQSLFHLQHVIKVINLGGCELSPKALAVLAQSLGTNWGLSLGLEELDISGSWGELASAAWGHLLGSMGSDARLSRLNMANSSFLGSYILRSLKDLPLTFLDISGINLRSSKTDDADLIDLISNSKTLNILRIVDTIKDVPTFIEVIKAVSKNPSFTDFNLDVSKNNIFTEGKLVPEFVEAIGNAKNISTLNIAGIGIKAKGTIALLNNLPQNIVSLVLDDNFEGSENSLTELSNLLAKLLTTHPNLSYLSIGATNPSTLGLGAKSNAIGIALRPFMKALKQNKTLLYLNINGQQIGDEVFSTLCRSLCVNTTLIGLKFADNNLSTNGYIALEQMMLQNTTLQFINFINDYQAFYEKLCSEKNAGDLLLELHECCILRRSGLSWAKEVFSFDSVPWDTPETVTPLLPVPSRLTSITADWNKLTEMIDETTKAPVGDGDDEPKTEGEGEPASDTPSRDSSGNFDISKKSVSKK